MFFHIVLTTKCNLQCKYCYGSSYEDYMEKLPENIDISYPESINYNIQTLKQFCDKDPDCTLTFYGGEPLCNIPKLTEIMDTVQPKMWMLQTNATYLNKLPSKYTNQFHTILTSIDGDQKITNYYRGNNVYEQVINNVKYVKQNDFKGELIARMTVREETNIFQAVTHLIEVAGYTSIHWQLDAMFWENDLKKRNFETWTKTNYNPDITKLIEYWVNDIKQNQRVLKIYPFLGIMHDLLHHNKTTKLRCGSGYANYSIQTDGTIIPCPAMLGMKDYYIGHIKNSDPLNLKQIHCKEPCNQCKDYDMCGGRCLYSNILKPWKDKGYKILCPTIIHLITELKKVQPTIQELINNKIIEIEQFNLIKFNGSEIIP